MRNILLLIFFVFGNLQLCIAQTNPLAKENQFALSSPVIESESVFFDKKNIVKINLGLKDVRIHYTLDGTNPTEQSPIFSNQISLTEAVVLKARAFHSQYLPSKIVKAQFVKLGKIFPIKNITLDRTPHEKYSGKGAKGLVDRKKGTIDFLTNEWMGFSGGDISVLIEFEKKEKIQKITTSMLSDQGSWIFLPQEIEVFCSKDGEKFKSISSEKIERTKENGPHELYFLDINFKKEKTKFIKVMVKNIPSIPEWHPGKGTPAWLFMDEILIE